MPRLMDTDNDQPFNIGGSSFGFTGTRIDHLTATEYTLVTIAVDETGSVFPFAVELAQMLVVAVDSCKKSPRADNILVRVLTFSSRHFGGVQEVHGFRPLSDIDTAQYSLSPGGATPLCDACFSSIGATLAYAEQLADQDYGVNGIFFVITDGEENASSVSARMVADEIGKAVKSEKLESVIALLIGINHTPEAANALSRFKTDAGMTDFIDAGDATPAKLAKLADFVAQSVSSQSQSLGTGGPSQSIAATI